MKPFEELYDTLPGNGWLSKEEARLIYNESKDITGAILEVGCYQGRSTVLLANTERIVYSVDPFENFNNNDNFSGDTIHQMWWENINSRDISNVKLWRQRIEEWNIRPVEFAYLDGDHTYQGTANQVKIALACGAKVIAIHDVNDTGDGKDIKIAALNLLGKWATRVERLAIWRLK